MKKITYLELLEMVKAGNPPKRVIYSEMVWMWGEESFTQVKNGEIEYLNECVMSLFTDRGLVKKKCIEVIDE